MRAVERMFAPREKPMPAAELLRSSSADGPILSGVLKAAPAMIALSDTKRAAGKIQLAGKYKFGTRHIAQIERTYNK